MYIGDFPEDYATLNYKFTTRTTAGVPFALASGVISVYESNSVTQITAGVTLTADFDSVTGLNNVLIDLSASALYAVNKDYYIVITVGTVNSVSVVGEVVGSFSIERAGGAIALLATAQADLDIITGAAGVVLDADAITSAKIADDAITTDHIATGALTADSFAADALVAATFATDSIAADALAADAVTEIQAGLATPTNITAGTITTVTNLTNAATSGDLTATMKASVNTEADAAFATYDPPTNTEMAAAFTEIKGATWASGTDTLEHIRDKQTDIETDTGEIGAAGAGLTDLATAANLATVDTVVDGIQADLDNATDGLGALKALIDALNDLSAADVNAEMVDVITVDAISEIAQGVPSATPNLADAVMLLYMALRNKLDVATSGTDTMEIHNSAGTRISQKLLTDDGSDYSEAKMTSGA